MIGKLRGIVEEIEDDSLILDVGGVGYHIFASARLLSEIEEGSEVSLSIEMNVREDHIHLYGFSDKIERDWFRLLATVQGVGNKVSLAILSKYSPIQLAQAILAKDIAAFKAVSGVGLKLAERIVTELKDKAVKLPVSEFESVSSVKEAAVSVKQMVKTGADNSHLKTDIQDAVSALVNLGYSRSDAYQAIIRAQKNSEENLKIDALIRLGLKELAIV